MRGDVRRWCETIVDWGLRIISVSASSIRNPHFGCSQRLLWDDVHLVARTLRCGPTSTDHPGSPRAAGRHAQALPGFQRVRPVGGDSEAARNQADRAATVRERSAATGTYDDRGIVPGVVPTGGTSQLRVTTSGTYTEKRRDGRTLQKPRLTGRNPRVSMTDSTGAISSVGQSASLTRRRSAVQVRHRPLT